MKRGVLLALAAAAAGCDLLTGDFRLTGVVEIAPALSSRAPRTNATLFVVARNAGGVPVAVHRIVNPEFPAPFTMGPADLLVPAIRRREPLSLMARLNAHGNLDRAEPGDLEGLAPGTVRSGDRGARVRLEKAL